MVGVARRSAGSISARVNVAGTRSRYVEAYERITGRPFAAWLERCGVAAEDEAAQPE